MRKSVLLLLLLLMGVAGGTTTTYAQSNMPAGTLYSPAGLYVSAVPKNIDITWNNEPISFVGASLTEYGDEFVEVSVTLEDNTVIPAKAFIMSSLGMPNDPYDNDLWYLEVALYEIDALKIYDGTTFSLTIPEGIIKNKQNNVNPAQTFAFTIVDTFNGYSVEPEEESKLPSNDGVVEVQFGGYPLEYLQSSVRFLSYGRMFKDYLLENGRQVNIEGNRIIIDLTGLEAGDCEVRIPEGFVLVDDGTSKYLNPEIWLMYTILRQSAESGVNSVQAEEENHIYTLQGIRTRKNDNNSVRGIYIENGKKLIR